MAADPDEYVDEQIDPGIVHRAIRELPDKARTILNLYALEGYKHREIAEILSISENTSKTQLLKAKNMLRDQLEKVFEY